MTRVGFIGAGRMGGPMVSRLVEAGHEVRGFARSAATKTALESSGARAVSTFADVGGDTDMVIICVFTDEQVREICLGSDLLSSMPRGSTLVLHTTGSPRTAEAVTEHAAQFGVAVVDSPVSGGPHDIAAGRLTLFVGGDANTLARIQPTLESYADPVLYVGPIGNGQRVKLVNNALFAAQIGLITEAAALGRQLGIDEGDLLAALPYGSSNSRALTSVSAKGSAAAFADSVGDFLRKDVGVVRKIVTELDGNLGLLDDAVNAALPNRV